MLGHFLFQPRGDDYLLTNDTGSYCFLSKEEFVAFIKETMPHDCLRWEELCDKQFCFDDSEESFIRRNEGIIRDANSYLFDSTTLFILAVTNECNNRCVYCQASGEKKPCHMQEDVADKTMEMIARSPSAKVTIEFQGGEPLINFRVIRYIIEKAKTVLQNKDVQFTLVSNLSLLTEEMAIYFKDNNVSVSTSLDGPANIHNLNRPSSLGEGTYETTLCGIDKLRKLGLSPGAIQTTTAASLAYPEVIVDTYAKLELRQLFLRPLTRLGAAAKCWDKIGYTPDQFLVFYKRALRRIIQLNQAGYKFMEYHAALFLNKILNGRSANYMELRSPCGAGLGQMAITANGNVYTCDEGRMMAEMGDEAFLLGNVFDNDYNEFIESPNCKAVCTASLLVTLPGCCDCVYKPYCGVCPVINYAVNGNITDVYKDKCQVYKGILDLLFEYIHEGDPEIMNIFTEWSDQI